MNKYKYEVEMLQLMEWWSGCVQFASGANFLKQDEVRLYRFNSKQGTDLEVWLFKNMMSEWVLRNTKSGSAFDELTLNMRSLIMSDMALILTVWTIQYFTKERKYMPHETINRIIL